MSNWVIILFEFSFTIAFDTEVNFQNISLSITTFWNAYCFGKISLKDRYEEAISSRLLEVFDR